MKNKYFYIATMLLLSLCTTSCRKVYHNCECAYINEYDEADTLLISVRARNQTQASEECAKSELNIARDEGLNIFCSLQR